MSGTVPRSPRTRKTQADRILSQSNAAKEYGQGLALSKKMQDHNAVDQNMYICLVKIHSIMLDARSNEET
jgi:hypothetical protein